MPIIDVEGMLRVVTTDLTPAPLVGGGAGNSLYAAEPGDGTWNAAPDDPNPDTWQVPFTGSSVTVLVQTAALMVRFSSDGGANYGAWITLAPGSWSFDLDVTDVQAQTATPANGAEYQLIAFA